MQVSVETTEGLERKMTIALPAEDITSAINERLQSLRKTARLNGFRPGKVPFNVVKKRFEPQVRSEVLGSMINQSFYDAVRQEELRPAGQPQIDEGEADGSSDGSFSYVATFEVYPDFDPIFNDAIQISRPAVEILSIDIDEMVDSLRKQKSEFNSVDRAAVDGDQLVIDFKGRLDGEEFEGGQAEEHLLVLGSGSMIEGFESQLIGVSAEEQKTIQVTFPEDYQAEDLAGKAVEFEISVREVKESHLPELNEALIKSFGIDDGNLDSLRADIKKNMSRELKQRIDNQTKTQIMDGLLDLNPINIPVALIQDEIKRQKEQLMQQMPGDADTSFLADDLFSEQAERRVRLGLVVGEIVQKREIKSDAEAVRAQVEILASSYQDPQEVIDYYYSNPEMLKNIEGLVLEEAVVALVLAEASITDETKTFQEVMNPPEADKSTETVAD